MVPVLNRHDLAGVGDKAWEVFVQELQAMFDESSIVGGPRLWSAVNGNQLRRWKHWGNGGCIVKVMGPSRVPWSYIYLN